MDSTSTPQLAADIELVKDEETGELRLQLVILESLTIRRDTAGDNLGGSTYTEALVTDGEKIAPGAVVARTEIRCKNPGEVRGIRQGAESVRRVLVVRDVDRLSIDTEGTAPTVKVGKLVVAQVPNSLPVSLALNLVKSSRSPIPQSYCGSRVPIGYRQEPSCTSILKIWYSGVITWCY